MVQGEGIQLAGADAGLGRLVFGEVTGEAFFHISVQSLGVQAKGGGEYA